MHTPHLTTENLRNKLSISYPYNDICLDMLIFPAYAVSKGSDHPYQETADVTGMSHAR